MSLSIVVVPPLVHGWRWWAWHTPGGQAQSFAAQPRCLSIRAMRWGSVCKRVLRPRSRTWVRPPRTAGMIPASQASRRASPAEMGSPVSRVAACPAPRRDSRVMVTTTVAAIPPAFGVPGVVAWRVWRYSVKACPHRNGRGDLGRSRLGLDAGLGAGVGAGAAAGAGAGAGGAGGALVSGCGDGVEVL